ncbi:alpha/beta fold hydrolase, partial [bacterium]|nr:alpha/beta fold hydrolase [bacterium]
MMQKIEFSWSTPYQLPIYACDFKPDTPAKAAIVLVHGIGEHIGRYEHVARMFTDHGYAMIGADLVGHGKSGGQRGHVDSYDDFLDIIDWMLGEASARYPDLPRFLYGHSLGGNLVLYYTEKRKPKIAG